MPEADRRVAVPDSERQYHIDAAQRRHRRVHPAARRPGSDREGGGACSTRSSTRTVTASSRPPRACTRAGALSCVSTGIGTDNVEIVRRRDPCDHGSPARSSASARAVRCKAEIEIGDLVVTTGAVRLEGTTKFYVHDGYPAVADYAAVSALVEAAHSAGLPATSGITATSPSFYGGQGRPIPQLPIRFPDLADEMARQGVQQLRDGGVGPSRSRGPCAMPCRCRVYGVRATRKGRICRRGTAQSGRKSVH